MHGYDVNLIGVYLPQMDDSKIWKQTLARRLLAAERCGARIIPMQAGHTP